VLDHEQNDSNGNRKSLMNFFSQSVVFSVSRQLKKSITDQKERQSMSLMTKRIAQVFTQVFLED